jgi:hypothetical protein
VAVGESSRPSPQDKGRECWGLEDSTPATHLRSVESYCPSWEGPGEGNRKASVCHSTSPRKELFLLPLIGSLENPRTASLEPCSGGGSSFKRRQSVIAKIAVMVGAADFVQEVRVQAICVALSRPPRTLLPVGKAGNTASRDSTSASPMIATSSVRS